MIVTQPQVTTKVGGAITMFTFLANHLHESGYDVAGVCCSSESGRPATLDAGIPLHNLYEQDGSTEHFDTKIQKLIAARRPDCIIFFFHYLYIDARLGREYDDIPRIITFHSRPDYYFTLHPWAVRRMRRRYRNTTAQILFDSYKALLPRFIRKGRVVTIPNPLRSCDVARSAGRITRRTVFLSRVDRMKGMDILIPAFAMVCRKHPDWTLDIWGEFESPELREEYARLARECGCADNIFFRGVTTNPAQTLSEYDFCIFPSRFEGFGLGLAESMSVGLPGIGLRRCSGVNQLIADGVNGFLCEEAPADMAAKINTLIEDNALLESMSAQALRIRERYAESHIKWLWSNLVEDCMNRKNEEIELFDAKSLL